MTSLPLDSKSHIRELDGVRGLAVIMVLVWHYGNCQFEPNDALQFGRAMRYLMRATGLFWSGVDLFFVLSGFLIGGILIDHSHKPRFYRVFYIRRAARILPLYALLVALYFACRHCLDLNYFSWLMSGELPAYSYLTFTQNIFMAIEGDFGGNFLAVTWSLAIEEQFYLILPLIFLLAGSNRAYKIIVALALAAPFLRLAMPGLVSVVNMPFRMDSLLIGVGVAYAFRSNAITTYINGSKALVWAVFVMLLAAMVQLSLQRKGRTFFEPFLIAMFYATFISLVLVYRDSKITAILRWSLLVRLGMYSYGLYMYHQMIAGLIHGYFNNGMPPTLNSAHGVALTLASLISTALVAAVSYSCYESYFVLQGRRFGYEEA